MPPWLIRFLCALALLACAPLVHAQTAQPVYRCIGAHGEPVFSGTPCGAPASSADNVADNTVPTSTTSACAASPAALRQDVAAAFATRDANRLAGLILWRGMSQASAQAALGALTNWLRQPLAGITFAGGTEPPVGATTTAAPAASAVPPTGMIVVTGGGAGNSRRFGLTETGGCWWLTF